ncbi:MAG: UDP-N-acetylmuramate dehydrogenase [Microgenomates group bacterium]
MQSVLPELQEKIEALIVHNPNITWKRNELLGPKSYFKIGGAADVFAEISLRDQLLAAVTFCHLHQIPITYLGGASNVVIDDAGVRGVVIKWTGEDAGVVENGKKSKLFFAEAGIKTATLVSKSVTLGFTGLEYFLGVPGTLGGAIYNNAHYMQDLIGEHVESVEVLGASNTFEWISKDNCAFAYEKSRFQSSKEVIVSVRFSLKSGEEALSKSKIADATRYRASTQPLGIPSSGCIFQNVPNTPELQSKFPKFADKKFVPAGFIIDRAGLKGLRVGDIEVSEKHAAWLINKGTGTADQVSKIIQKIKESVQEKYGVSLTEEVFYLR